MAHNNYNMGVRGLPDICTRSPRAAGTRVEGAYIRQTTRAHMVWLTITYSYMYIAIN